MGNWAPTKSILSLLNEAKLELLAILGAAAAVVLVVLAIKYQQADGHEKAEVMRKIKATIYITVGTPAAIWLAAYVYDSMRKIL